MATAATQDIDVYKEWLGIPEGPRPPDHYTLLRLVQFEDDEQKVRRNYTRLNAHVRKYATGQYAVRSQELLNELAKAMLCLTDPQRKREYDKSLGREIEEAEELRKSLGRVLIDEGRITAEQLKEAEGFAMARGLSMRDAVVQMKLADAETAARAYAQELGYSYLDLSQTAPDDSMLDKVPRSFVKRNSLVPLFEDEGMLLVACVHDPPPDVEEELRLRYEMSVRPVIATPLAVNQAIARYYAPGMRDEAAAPSAKDQAGKPAKARKTREKAKPKAKPVGELTDEERRNKKFIAVIVACWVTIGAGLIDSYVLLPRGISVAMGYFLTLFVAPLAALYVFFTWKKY